MKKSLFLLELVSILIISIVLIIAQDNSQKQKNKDCLSLTFDDGLESQYMAAYSLLKEKNFSATFFIIANITSDPDLLNRNFMTPAEIKKLIENNFEIGSHTLSHPMLISLSNEEIEKELKESKELLEKNYKISVNSLAFPYSRHNNNILIMAKKYYGVIRDETFQVYSFALKKDTNVKEAGDYIAYAKLKNRHIAIIFHDIIQRPKI